MCTFIWALTSLACQNPEARRQDKGWQVLTPTETTASLQEGSASRQDKSKYGVTKQAYFDTIVHLVMEERLP